MNNRSAVPDSYPTAYPETSATGYPQQWESHAHKIDPGMMRPRGAAPAIGTTPGVKQHLLVRNHRGTPGIHAGKRTHDSIRRSMASGAAIGAGMIGTGSMDPVYSGTVGEFISPERIATSIPGAVAGGAIGAAAAYGLRKKLG